eukprot:m.42942 g.42942  ORF g.42942 m.42942 type:complete len:165 (+) comp33399_c1_seq12:2898-3392(+)
MLSVSSLLVFAFVFGSFSQLEAAPRRFVKRATSGSCSLSSGYVDPPKDCISPSVIVADLRCGGSCQSQVHYLSKVITSNTIATYTYGHECALCVPVDGQGQQITSNTHDALSAASSFTWKTVTFTCAAATWNGPSRIETVSVAVPKTCGCVKQNPNHVKLCPTQ